MTIRKADLSKDYDGIWEIFSTVISTGDTYAFSPETPKEDLSKIWFAPGMDTFVACNEHGEIIGTYFIKPNQLGLGNHIANCGYMVSPNARGQGVGRTMCEHSQQYAIEKGFRGIQFNIVVSTNEGAVRLWRQCGFSIIGTTPKGFKHRQLGYVDSHIMFKALF